MTIYEQQHSKTHTNKKHYTCWRDTKHGMTFSSRDSLKNGYYRLITYERFKTRLKASYAMSQDRSFLQIHINVSVIKTKSTFKF